MRLIAYVLLLGSVLVACDRAGKDEGRGTTVIEPVEPRTAPDAGDVAIASAVEAELRAEPTLRELPLRVLARNGTVVLEGAVDSVQSAQHAGVIAAAVEGVNQVDNRLAVKQPD